MSILRFGRVAAGLVVFWLPFSAEAVPSHSLDAPNPAVCLAQSLSAEVQVDAPGRWNNPDRPGTGWELSYNEDRTTVEAIWYTFSESGQPEWLTTGQIQWTVQGWPVGVTNWSGPLLRQGRVDGQPTQPERIGQVSFTRVPDDATRLAVRWQLDGQSSYEDECLVDRTGVGFGGESLEPNLARGWAETGYAQYRLQWVVEPSDNGNSRTRRERPDLLTYSASGAPIWLTAHANVTVFSANTATQNFQYRYYTGAYSGGRPTQAATASCIGAPHGCASARGNVGKLTRKALRDGQIDWSMDLRRLTAEPALPEIIRNDVQAVPVGPGPQVRTDFNECTLLPEFEQCPVVIELLPAGESDLVVEKVNLGNGERTAVELDENGTAMVPLEVGRFRFEAVRPLLRAKSTAGASVETVAVSFQTTVTETSARAATASVQKSGSTCSGTTGGWPASGADYCEPDDSQYGGFFGGGTYHHHNFHHGADMDRRTFWQLNNYAGYIRFEPQSLSEQRWSYQVIRVDNQQIISQGVLGGFSYQTIVVPGAVSPYTNSVSYRLNVSPLDTGFSGTPTRYKLIRWNGYDPAPIGADAFEVDNGSATSMLIQNGNSQLRNFHNDQDRDWIKLNVAAGDVQTITLQPQTPTSSNKWEYEVQKKEAVGTSVVQTARDFGWSPVAPAFALDSSVWGAGEYYVRVGPRAGTQFYGAQSIYTASLSVVTTIQPDAYDQGSGDNTRLTATPLSVGVQQLHNFHTGSDRDWMSFAAQANSTINFAINPQVQTSTAPKFVAQLWKLNAQGVAEAIGAAQGGTATFGYPGTTLTQMVPAANQTYWLEMTSNDGSFVGSPSAYGVTVTTQLNGDIYEPDNDAGVARLLSDLPQNHDFHVSFDQDWYKVALQPGYTAHFDLRGTGSTNQFWRVQTFRGDASNPTLLTTQAFGGDPFTAAVAHSGGSSGEWVYARVYPAISVFHGPGTEYTAQLRLTGGPPATGCDLSDWTSTVGSPQPVATPRYFGTCALQASSIGQYVVNDQAAAESTYNARFYYYTGNRSGGSADILQARSAGGLNLIRVQHDGNALSFNVNGSGTTRSVVVADDRWYMIELQWKSAASGSLIIGVTGNNSDTPLAVSPITGINNSSDRIEEVRLGLITGSGSGSVGFDEFQARRITHPKRICRGDAVPDGIRDVNDIAAVIGEINAQSVAIGQADATEDGNIDVGDLAALQALINSTPVCP